MPRNNTNYKSIIITIDGPTASGKSSVAQALAGMLGYEYINSGLLYRALAYLFITEGGYTQDDLTNLGAVTAAPVLDKYKSIRYTYTAQAGTRIWYHDRDITSLLKTPQIDRAASVTSAYPWVRELVVNFQRALGERANIIADGRDCGTVIYPQAPYKFFLTAALSVRARRWQKDLEQRGIIVTFEQAYNAVKERDTRDKERIVSPLIVPEGAIIVDNSYITLEQTVTLLQSYLPVSSLKS